MEASPLRSNDNGLLEGNVFETASLRLLKSKAIYGSNASGKSNLAKALENFCYMVSGSVIHEGLPKRTWDNRFKLITDWDDSPVFFQYIFLHNEIIYRYGFQVLDSSISYEWLYSVSGDKEIEYFMRKGLDLQINKDAFPGSDLFIQQMIKGDNELFRDDSLFLTAGALTGNKLLTVLRNEIRSIIIVDGIYDEDAIGYTMKHLVHGTDIQKQAIIQLLKAADTGVDDLEIRELPDELSDWQHVKESGTQFSVFVSHSRYDEHGTFKDKITVPFGEWESEGTGKLLGISGLILDAFNQGRTIVIDEFDARFHPNLTLKIVQLFHNKITNPKNAQIIFVTHDSGLLRRADLRRDQICLIDKDSYGVSTITNLIEYRGVRKDASYEKEYLNGSYSAVPFLDEMDWVFTQNSNQDGLQQTK
ncbi:ATP/GTP-binding protein [Chitinophaga sp. RCC_12]|uniref:AAA family ATPase n=1 Tax=Chitinophaga sp. RCC_12 TaxID=3239226 RepID=UPI003524ABCB